MWLMMYKVKFVSGNLYELVLVSDMFGVEEVGKKFEVIREEYADLRERSLALKAYLKELSGKYKFLFVVIDDMMKCVFVVVM